MVLSIYNKIDNKHPEIDTIQEAICENIISGENIEREDGCFRL